MGIKQNQHKQEKNKNKLIENAHSKLLTVEKNSVEKKMFV